LKKKKFKEATTQKKDKKEKKKSRVDASLEQVQSIHAQLKSTSDEEELIKCLKTLRGFSVSLEFLVQSEIGKTIKKLSKHESVDVSNDAKALMKRYRKVISHEVKSGKGLTVTDEKSLESTTKEVVEKETEPKKPMETVSTEEKSHDINNENKEDPLKNVEEKEISKISIVE